MMPLLPMMEFGRRSASCAYPLAAPFHKIALAPAKICGTLPTYPPTTMKRRSKRKNLLYDEEDWPESSHDVSPPVYPPDPKTVELLQGLPQSQACPPPSEPPGTEIYPLSEAWRDAETRRRESWQITQATPSPQSYRQVPVPKRPPPRPRAHQNQPAAPKAKFTRFWLIVVLLAGLLVLDVTLILVKIARSKNLPAAENTAHPTSVATSPISVPVTTPAAVAAPAAVATVASQPPEPALPASAQPVPQATAKPPTKASKQVVTPRRPAHRAKSGTPAMPTRSATETPATTKSAPASEPSAPTEIKPAPKTDVWRGGI